MEDTFLWWRDGVIYQIYPRSFQDTSGNGLGDLNGIRERLGYLADLGINAIWLSPIYPSPDVDFGYDVADYFSIDPRYGTMEEFHMLVEESHSKDIRVILDLVLNHTSDQHEWFQRSRSSIDDPYHDWYIWKDPKPGGGPPNNWQSVFGGSAWEFVPELGQYYLHMFYKQQPDVNWRNPEVRRTLLDVFRFWLEKDVDGFRLDVFNLYFKHPDLPDNPVNCGIRPFDWQKHLYDVDQPDMFPLLKEIRELLDSYPERYAVGETFSYRPEVAAQYCTSQALHATFNFNLSRAPWKPARMLQVTMDWEKALDDEGWPTQVFNNHDVKRSTSRFGLGEDDERMKVAAALLLTLRGTPFMYYGEEIGMRNLRIPRREIKDPVGKYYSPFYKGRDGCRTPMQWNGERYAGFSKEKPWLPVHPDYRFRNERHQSQDPDSLLNFYRSLLQLRRRKISLQKGIFLPLNHEPRSILAYIRQTKDQLILVALNFSRRPLRLALGKRLAKANWQLLLSNKHEVVPEITSGLMALEPEEACILEMLEEGAQPF
jgi:alpha-glucosidase